MAIDPDGCALRRIGSSVIVMSGIPRRAVPPLIMNNLGSFLCIGESKRIIRTAKLSLFEGIPMREKYQRTLSLSTASLSRRVVSDRERLERNDYFRRSRKPSPGSAPDCGHRRGFRAGPGRL